MKKWKKSAASMLLLLLMVSVAACGRNNGTAADENTGTGNEAGVENNSGNTGLDGRPFDEIRMVMAFMIIRMWMEMDFWRRSEEMPMMWWMMW